MMRHASVSCEDYSLDQHLGSAAVVIVVMAGKTTNCDCISWCHSLGSLLHQTVYDDYNSRHL